jgi:hypothetical protein
MPLLEFHEFDSECTNSTDSDTSSSEDKMADEKNGEDDEHEDEVNRVEDKDDTAGGPLRVSNIAKYPEHALKRHPFIMTRYVQACPDIYVPGTFTIF